MKILIACRDSRFGVAGIRYKSKFMQCSDKVKTRVFTDMLGRKIVVPDPLTRVALLGGPTGQIAYILGARNQLCAVTKSLKSSELVNMMDPTVKEPRRAQEHKRTGQC